ncbi:MAG: biopolymer transporter ExbD [Elusimicrobia bacterium]|nr:biopolymer transporter ExbD [Elusimicrobiota bacterium]
MNPFHKAHELQEISEINVVPLADVSLVLLIILLVLSPMMAQHRLQVQAAAEKSPSASAEAEPETPPQRPVDLVLVVGLGADRFVVGERTFTGNGELAAYLTGALLLRQDRKVFLAPQPDVAHGRVVETIELLKSAGAASVALVQSAPEEPAP